MEAFTSMISGHAHRGEVEEAFQLLTQMSDLGIRPNSFTLTSLVKACFTANNKSAVESLIRNTSYFEHFSRVDKAAVIGSYVSGVCGLAIQHQNQLTRIRLLLQAQLKLLDMYDNGLSVDTATINALLKGLCEVLPGGVLMSFNLLQAMTADGIAPDEYTYSILLTALGREGYTSEALQLYKSASIELDGASFNALLKAFVDGSSPLQAVQFFFDTEALLQSNTREIQDLRPVQPTQVTFTILFLALIRSISKDIRQSSDDEPKAYPTDGTTRFMDVTSEDIMDIYKSVNAESSEESKSCVANCVRLFVADGGRIIRRNLQDPRRPNSKASFELSTSDQWLSRGPNQIMRQLYRRMRFTYKIEVDDRMVGALNALFSLSPSNYESILDGLWGGFIGYEKETARLIFEDLVISGFHPKDVSTYVHSQSSLINCCERSGLS